MSAEENKTILRRALEEIFSQGNLAVADEIYDKDFVGHSAPEEIRGPEGIKRSASMFRNAFPDLQFTIEDQIAEGDKVVARWIGRGTHKGELMGIAPTGRQVTMTGITISRVANGKIVESWVNRDTLGMLQQLGAVPAPGQAGNEA